MITGQDKKAEFYRYQATMEEPLKMILTRSFYTNNRNYNALPYNYGYPFHVDNLTLFFILRQKGLTQNERCFTPKKLQRQRKAKWQDIVELVQNDKINKQVRKKQISSPNL